MTHIKTGIGELDTILQEGLGKDDFVMFLGIPVRIPRGIPQPDPENDPDRTVSWSPLEEGQEEVSEVETQKRQKSSVWTEGDTGGNTRNFPQGIQPTVISSDDTET
jgi:hypothetical protein